MALRTQITMFTLLIMFYSLYGMVSAMSPRSNALAQYAQILDDQNKPTAALQQLLSLLKIEHDGSLQSLVDVTRREWVEKIRPGTTERWEIDASINENLEKNRTEILPFFHQTGFCEELYPANNHYNYAVLLGCTCRTFCERLSYLINKHHEGIVFDTIIVLVGDRPLNKERENNVVYNEIVNKLSFTRKNSDHDDFPKTETEMATFILNDIELPAEWKSIPLLIVGTPMKINDKGETVRPTTADTVVQWLKMNPIPGSILSISNQPYCLYQDSVLKTLLPEDFVVETVGFKASKKTSVAHYFDTLARFLYQENIRRY